MVKEISIEKATANDSQLVSDLSIVTFIETYRGTCTDKELEAYMEAYFNERQIEDELSGNADQYFIAYADGFPAGYIRIIEDYSDYPDIIKYKALELKRIYVLQDYQSQKVGAALMRFALQLAIKKDFEAIWLSVWEENVRGINFYSKFGFKDTGCRHTFYIGSTAQTDHWMIKLLPE